MKNLFYLFLTIFFVVSCTSDNIPPQEVTQIKISYVTKRFYVANKYDLSVDYIPSHLSTPNYIWESSDISKASIDQNGTLTTKQPGRVVIRVHMPNSSLSDSIVINLMEWDDVIPPSHGQSPE